MRAETALIIAAAAFAASCASQQPVQHPPVAKLSPWSEHHQPAAQDTAALSRGKTPARAEANASAAVQDPAQGQPDKADETAGGEPGNAPYDPLSPLNEKILAFNVFFDDHVGRPAGTAWSWAMPYQARLHIRNFFRNTGEPKNFVNCMLQSRFHDAEITAERFSINSTLGVGGFFDVAHRWFGLQRKPTDFGLTAAHRSVKYGPYLMTPAGGPTSVRDAAGSAIDGQLNLISILIYAVPSLAILPVTAGLGLIDAINERSLDLESFDDVDRYTVDLYGAVQDGYYQKRAHDQPPPGSSE